MSTPLKLTVPEYESMVNCDAFDAARLKHDRDSAGRVRLTITQYEKMVEQGAFDVLRNSHIELIRGELRQMSPQRPPHSRAIVYLTYWSAECTAADDFKARIQLPLRIPALDSEPEPDVALVKTDIDRSRHPEPSEVLLVIEVADTTLAIDLGDKADLYAEAGIADYWVVDLPNQLVHVFREPSDQGYLAYTRHAAGERIRPLLLAQAELDISALLSE